MNSDIKVIALEFGVKVPVMVQPYEYILDIGTTNTYREFIRE